MPTEIEIIIKSKLEQVSQANCTRENEAALQNLFNYMYFLTLTCTQNKRLMAKKKNPHDNTPSWN